MIPRWLARCAFVLPWICAGAIGAWFILLRFPPSGRAEFSFVFDGSSPWMDRFLPGERAYVPQTWDDGWTGQRIIMDPVYASLRTPGLYDTVDVTLEARTIRQPLVEIGMVRSLDPYQVEMRPAWSEALSKGWRHVTVGDVSGFVREGRPDRDLVEASFDRLMTWYSSGTIPAIQDAPTPTITARISFRGALDLSFIPTSEETVFSFVIQDMNRSRGGNIVAFQLTRGSDLVSTEAIGASGIYDKRPNAQYTKTLKLGRLSPGIYKLSLMMDDDVFVRSISTNVRHWVMGPRAYVADEVGYSTSTPSVTLWTNSQHLAVETAHVEGRQTVSLGTAFVDVAKTHVSYPLNRTNTERDRNVSLRIPKGDMRVVGDGYFAISPEALFYPQPRRLTDASDPIAEGVYAIRTPYIPPQRLSDGWMRLHGTFRLLPLDVRPKIVLATPGMFPRDGALDIRATRLVYTYALHSWQEWIIWVKRELGVILQLNRLL